MTNLKRSIIWGVLFWTLALIIFSIYGAFIGTSRASVFFNSPPLAIYWVSFTVLLAGGIVIFKRLYQKPGLLLIHLGCIGVLLGAIWGSETGHTLQKKLFKIDKLRSGKIVIYKGKNEHRVIRKGADIGVRMGHDDKVVFYDTHDSRHPIVEEDDKRIYTLPFEIRLNDFRIEFYDNTHLKVRSADGTEYILDPIKAGTSFKLDDRTILTIVKVYKNLKLRKQESGFTAYDDEGSGSNPAVKTHIRFSDGTEEMQFAFTGFSGEMGRKRRVSMQLKNAGMVSDYFSDLLVEKDGKAIVSKTIEVNDPLHHGGYHFYQSSYDDRGGRYTVLSVMSDTGLYTVYAGLWIMGIGMMWIMWVNPVMKHHRKKSSNRVNHGA